MKMTLFIVTKSGAILALLKLQDEFKSKGIPIIQQDTYSFVAQEGSQFTKVYWDGGFIEAEQYTNKGQTEELGKG